MEIWKKITGIDDFKKMGKNTPLIKYPLEGEPKDEIDLTDKNNLSTYLVDKVKMFNELDLIDPELGKEFYSTTLGKTVTGNVLHKKFQDMIDERIWWYRPKQSE